MAHLDHPVHLLATRWAVGWRVAPKASPAVEPLDSGLMQQQG
jgi:hypothetical protein